MEVTIASMALITSSSAVADRPCYASCLSVVSFSSTIPRAPSFIVSYFGFRFTAAYNSVLFCSPLFGVFVHAAVCWAVLNKDSLASPSVR